MYNKIKCSPLPMVLFTHNVNKTKSKCVEGVVSVNKPLEQKQLFFFETYVFVAHELLTNRQR